jgi:hypothetical protein
VVDRLLALLFGETARAVQSKLGFDPIDLIGAEGARGARRDLMWLRRAAANPFAAVAHCLCEPR